MIRVKLNTVEEYYGKGAWEDEIFLKVLENKYPVLYERTMEVLQNICKLNGDNSSYSEDELLEIFFTDEVIEVFEDLYFENNNCGENEIIVHYFVRDENHTDKCVEYLTLVDGYKLL